MKEYPYRVTIDDGFAVYAYVFPTNGELSIEDIAKEIQKFILSRSSLEGEYLGPSEIGDA